MSLLTNLSLAIGTIILNGVIGVDSSYRYGIIPSGGTFGIWSIIYFSLIYSIMTDAQNWNRLSTFYFFLSCVGNVSWLYFWSIKKINYGIVSLFLLPLSLLLLWNNLLKKSNNIVLNSIALYAGWTIGAFLLNIYISSKEEKKRNLNSFLKNINLEKLAVVFFCLAQILWQIYGLFRDDKKVFYKSSIAIPLVGIWTSIGIINNGNKVKQLGYIYLGTSVISLIHHLSNV